MSIPDLSAQVAAQGSRASYGLRRAACHQITGSDDETTGALAACLAAIPPGAPRT